MEDQIKLKGFYKPSSPDAGGANLQSVPLIGIVKDNVDPIRAGRLWVYLLDNSGSDPEDALNWRRVSYLSPFFGRTNPNAGETGDGKFKLNSSSYGMWSSPPDIGTQVLCIFVNGDMNYGYYIGAVPEPESLRMVPAIGGECINIGGAKETVVLNEGEAEKYGGALRVPVTNLNYNNTNQTNTDTFLTMPKPVHTYSASIMHQQGIIRDPIRGPISSSSQRETPSRVGWGVSTPGRPIYEGGFNDETLPDNLDKDAPLKVLSRRGGHTIVMDDGDAAGKDQVVRIRTALGHQILMSDDGQTLMILHSNGHSYIELGKEGTVDIFATNSINLRTQGDINFHADRDINLHAAKALRVHAETITVDSDKDYNQRTGTTYKQFTMGTHTVKANGPLSMDAGGEASLASKSITYINGSKVNLNTGKTSTVPAEVIANPKNLHTDTFLHDTVGFIAAPGALSSITSRAPAHAPWDNAGKGVDIKTSLTGGSSTASSPSGALQKVNSLASNVTNPVSPGAASLMPSVGAISDSLNPSATSSILGAMATNAAASPLANAISKGSTIAQTAAGKVGAVGQFALNPQQLEAGGYLKQGSASLVDSMIQSGANLNAAMTNNLFTGKEGVSNLNAFITNSSAQANAAVNVLQKAQTSLTSAGVMTGAEDSTQLAGLVLSGATQGVSNTINAFQSLSGTSGTTPSLSGFGGRTLSGGAMNAIASGNYAAGLAQSNGGLGSILQSVQALGRATGVTGAFQSAGGATASAFNAIARNFRPLKPNVPQNLTAIALRSAARIAGISAGTSSGSAGSSAGTSGLGDSLINTAAGIAGRAVVSNYGSQLGRGGLAVVSAVARDPVGALTDPLGLLTNVAGRVGLSVSGASSYASGVNNLPGGASAVTNILNNSLSASNRVPGTQDLSRLIKTATSAALNGTASPAGLASLGKQTLTAFVSSKLSPGAASKLQSAISSISGGGRQPSTKLPTAAVNTINRAPLVAQIKSALNDPGIPEPLPLTSATALEDIASRQAKIDALRAKFASELRDRDSQMADRTAQGASLRDTFNQLKNSLPPGDPRIEAAKQQEIAFARETAEFERKIEASVRETEQALYKAQGYKS